MAADDRSTEHTLSAALEEASGSGWSQSDPPVGLADVLATDQLSHRTSREPDLEAQNRALQALAHELAASRSNLLQKLAETVLELCPADSAGISVPVPDEGQGFFRWDAVAGALAQNVGDLIPRDNSPSGTAVIENAALLFDRPQRHFAALADLQPSISEQLLVPFHANGEPVGTLWAARHKGERRFDAEDVRLLRSLSSFASVAYQLRKSPTHTAVARNDFDARIQKWTQDPELGDRTKAEADSTSSWLQALFEHSLDAILLADDDGRYVDANPGASQLLGFTNDEIRARNVWDITPEGNREEGLRQWRQFIAARTMEGEFTIVRKDGTLVETEFRATANIIPGLHLSILRDISARKRSEKVLRESEERFRLLADAVPQIIWITDAEGRNQFFNRQWSEYTGTAYEPTTAAHVAATAVHPDDARITMERFDESRRTGRTFEVEHRIRSASGEYRWFLVRAEPYRDPNTGKITRWVGASVDIHDRKLAEAALRESEARFRAVADLVPDLLWRADPSGGWTWGNQRWMEYTGQTPEEALDEGWAEMIHPEEREAALQGYHEAVRTGETLRHEYRIRRADGAYRWFLVEAMAVHDESGSITHWLGASTDVHDQRTAMEMLEERVEEQTRQIREMAQRLTMAEQGERRRISQILHDDLQQLLFGVEMKMDMVSRDLHKRGQGDLSRGIAEARGWIDRAIATTRQLTVDLSPLVLRNEGLVDALVWLQTQMHEMHGMDVVIEADHSWYISDEDLRVLLFQIVRELLFNVRKHAGTTGAMVRLVEDDGHLVIHVIDQGKGFEPDKRATSREGAGGFGLYSVKERLKLVGGDLQIESQLGEGTHVTVHAPVTPSASSRHHDRLS